MFKRVQQKINDSQESVHSQTSCSVGIQLVVLSLLVVSRRDKVRKRSHLPSSSPFGSPHSNHPHSNPNPPTKYPQVMEFAIHSTITTCGHQFLLLAKVVHTRSLRKYTPSLSQVVFVLLRVFSSFSVFPIRGSFHQSLITDTSGGVKW